MGWIKFEIVRFILKFTLDKIISLVTHIANLSLEARKFPSNWKVISFLKKYDPLKPKNYRPANCVNKELNTYSGSLAKKLGWIGTNI